MKRLLLVLACLVPAFSQTNPAKLPVNRVVLYKNGVGYFEHTGSITGTQDLTVDFTSAQLNDALKSLTILDQGEGRITGVRYNSATPLEQQLNTLHLTLAKDITYADLLTALRGSRVEVREKALATTGRILAVEERQLPQADNRPAIKQTLFSVVTDAGEVRSFVVTPTLAVRPVEGDIRDDLSRYLQMLAAARAQDLRRITVTAQGSGTRNIFVSYISEVPVWKTSYRILLPSEPSKPALLQGWAIVDNTVGEDWKNVQLSLVSGAPQSFVQNLSQPYYMRRPQIPLPEAAMLTPQTHESGSAARAKAAAPGTLTGTVTDPSGAVIPNANILVRNNADGSTQNATTDAQGNYEITDLGAGNYTLTAQAPGFRQMQVGGLQVSESRGVRQDLGLTLGASTESVEVSAEAAAAPSGGPQPVDRLQQQYAKLGGVIGGIIPPPSNGVGSMTAGAVFASNGAPAPALSLYEAVSERLPSAESASTQELAGLFEYTIKDRVSVAKNQSALVPILNTRISAERVTLWNANEPTPLRAIWLQNTSADTLDGGSFSILDANAFAGEGIFDTIRPKEKRLLSYAVDDAIHISREGERTRKPLRHIRIAKGVMTETSEERETATYTVRNSDIHPRAVILEHPRPANWTLVSEAKPEESTADVQRFRVKVAPGEVATLKIEMMHPLLSNVRLFDQGEESLGLLIKHVGNDSELARKLKPVVDKRGAISALDLQINAARSHQNDIQQDQQRLRENMKALKGSAEERALLQRYTSELNTQEDDLAELKKRITDLESQRNQRTTELADQISYLNFDSDL